MNELRLILAGLALPTLGAIWWWSARRGSQVRGAAELRESTAAHAGRVADPLEERAAPALRERVIRPLEPLAIRTDDPEPEIELSPISVYADPVPLGAAAAVPSRSPVEPPIDELEAAEIEPHTDSFEIPPAEPRAAPVVEPRAAPVEPRAAPVEPRAAPAEPRAAPVEPRNDTVGTRREGAGAAGSELQRIVAVRLCAVNDSRWPGRRLLGALESHGLAFGRYQVFHRRHSDGRSIFCVASLGEPGAFDLQRMANDAYRGITLFAVLPGPLAPLQALDEMLGTARDLARELTGILQDDRGMPFSPQRAAALREDVARFQAR